MISIKIPGISSLKDYSEHLKSLPEEDKFNRFGYKASDYAIDQLILDIVYHSDDHEMWVATDDMKIVGWAHMARDEEAWELAVSVIPEYQGRGIGSQLIAEMIDWAKIHHIPEVYMHCIESNKVIQHLASKHNLKTRERGGGERTAAMEVPEPTFLDVNGHLWKEHMDIMTEYAKLRQKLSDLWFKV